MNTFAIFGKEGIFTTSEADFLVPSSLYDSFISEIIKAAGSVEKIVKGDLIHINCNERGKFPVIWFMVGKEWLSLDPENYL